MHFHGSYRNILKSCKFRSAFQWRHMEVVSNYRHLRLLTEAGDLRRRRDHYDVILMNTRYNADVPLRIPHQRLGNLPQEYPSRELTTCDDTCPCLLEKFYPDHYVSVFDDFRPCVLAKQLVGRIYENFRRTLLRACFNAREEDFSYHANHNLIWRFQIDFCLFSKLFTVTYRQYHLFGIFPKPLVTV